MSRSEEIRDEAVMVINDYKEKIGKVPAGTINLDFQVASFAMLAEIACQLADMNERNSK